MVRRLVCSSRAGAPDKTRQATLISEHSTAVEAFARNRSADGADGAAGVLQRTQAPTLVITADRTKMHTVEEARAYRRLIPDSSLVVIRSDAYHIAAADADEYVTHTLAFLEALDARPGDARLQPRRISAPASSRG